MFLGSEGILRRMFLGMVGKMVPGFLLTESVDTDGLEYLVENKNSTDGKPKIYRIKGKFGESTKRNRNGRIYPREIMEREVNRYYKEFVLTKRAVSDLDHPNSSTPLFANACHLIEDLKMDGDIVLGSARIMDTPAGKIAKTLIDEGVQLAISSRAVGSLGPDNVVGDNFHLIGWDIVVSPSVSTAFVESIVENQQYIVDGNKLIAVNMEQFNKNLAKNGTRNLYNDLNKFLTSLSRKI